MKSVKFILLLCGVLFCTAPAGADAALDRECELILSRMRGTPKVERVNMEKFRPDGTWSDIDYQCQASGRWVTLYHLGRTLQLAAYDRESALKALAAWVRLKPRCPNWWANCIAVPMHLADILIRIGIGNVPPDLRAAVRPLLYERPSFGLGGQNLVWVTGIRAKEGLLYRDPEMVRESLAALNKDLVIRPFGREGIRQDWSFQQHGAQLQFGNYGLGYFCDQVYWARMLRGTRFEYSPEKICLLEHFFMDGFRWTLWDGIMDFSCCGRQLMPRDQYKKYRTVLDGGTALLELLTPERQKPLKEWLAAPGKLYGVRVYPCSGYLAYHSPDGWHFSVKMNSAVLVGSETCNGENIRGLYQGDGAAFFGIKARYTGYPALSDARMIPGTTEIQDQRDLTPLDFARGKRNPRGYYAVWAGFPAAVAAYRLDTGDLTADKVYFVTSSGITGSGSDIRSDSGFPVVTCIDQFRADSEKDFPVVCQTPAGAPKAERTVSDLRENWKNCFREQRSAPVSGKIVKLFINHGVKPRGTTYFYQLRKAGSTAGQEIRLKTSSVRIHAIQAEGRILAAAFTAGTVTLPDQRKCAVKPGITVLDPAGKQLAFAAFRTH